VHVAFSHNIYVPWENELSDLFYDNECKKAQQSISDTVMAQLGWPKNSISS